MKPKPSQEDEMHIQNHSKTRENKKTIKAAREDPQRQISDCRRQWEDSFKELKENASPILYSLKLTSRITRIQYFIQLKLK